MTRIYPACDVVRVQSLYFNKKLQINYEITENFEIWFGDPCLMLNQNLQFYQ